MTPDTLQRLAAETQRDRLREAAHERLAARSRLRRRRTFAPRFGETVGHLLAGHRQPAPR
jgi:hypothetical protein